MHFFPTTSKLEHLFKCVQATWIYFSVNCYFICFAQFLIELSHQCVRALLELLTSVCMLRRSVMSNTLQPMECNPPGFSVHSILQARLLERVAISFSRKSSQSRNGTSVSWFGRQILYQWGTWEALINL